MHVWVLLHLNPFAYGLLGLNFKRPVQAFLVVELVHDPLPLPISLWLLFNRQLFVSRTGSVKQSQADQMQVQVGIVGYKELRVETFADLTPKHDQNRGVNNREQVAKGDQFKLLLELGDDTCCFES